MGVKKTHARVKKGEGAAFKYVTHVGNSKEFRRVKNGVKNEVKNEVKNGRPRKFTSHWRPIVGSSILLISCAQLVCSSCLPSSSRLLILFPISSAHCCCTSRLLIPSGHLV